MASDRPHSAVARYRPYWHFREITALDQDACDCWFYGLVRERGRLKLTEIFPGLGYASAWPMWSPKSWWWAVRDVYIQTKRSK